MQKTLLILTSFMLTSATLFAQNKIAARNNAYWDSKKAESVHNISLNTNKTTAVACVDQVNYVGNTYGTPEMCGGVATGTEPWIFFQIYPGFSGQVTRVDFRGAKISANSNGAVGVWALDAFGAPTGTQLASANVVVNGGWNMYGANFSSPVNVTNGFAAGVIAPQLADSFMVACGPDFGQPFSNSAYAYDDFNGLYPFFDYKDFIIRPTVSFNMPTLSLNTIPSNPCLGTNVTLNGNSSSTPSFFYDPLFNSNVEYFYNFGDGSPVVTTQVAPPNPESHTYNISGNFTATYGLEYIAWGATCSTTTTNNINISGPAVSNFSYGTVDLLLTVVNMSTGASSYSWNFGDLTTSNLQNPPVHDYGQTQGAGTYVVELTTTGVCGNGYQSKTINVQMGTTTGLTETVFDESIFVYPNPVSSNITVRYEFANEISPKEIYITDIAGREVAVKTIDGSKKGEIVFDISALAKGTYFVKLSTDSRSTNRQFIKN